MNACEPCWNEAYRQSRLLGGSQVDHYRRLLEARPLPIHRTEAGYPSCSTCDGGGCYDCTDPA